MFKAREKSLHVGAALNKHRKLNIWIKSFDRIEEGLIFCKEIFGCFSFKFPWFFKECSNSSRIQKQNLRIFNFFFSTVSKVFINISINIYFLKRSQNIIQYSYMYIKKNIYMHDELYIYIYIQKSIFDMRNKFKQHLTMQ